MENLDFIERNVATNIGMLRKNMGWKQSEFAKKLNFSDKSISKWERGESMPDITTLKKIADLFNVSIDYLTEEHKQAPTKTSISIRDLLVTITFCVAAFLISTIIFIAVNITKQPDASKYWVSFVYGALVCAAIVNIYSKIEHYWLCGMISLSSIAWLAITCAYLTLLVNGSSQYWMLFLVGVPIQAAICLLFFVKKN